MALSTDALANAERLLLDGFWQAALAELDGGHFHQRDAVRALAVRTWAALLGGDPVAHAALALQLQERAAPWPELALHGELQGIYRLRHHGDWGALRVALPRLEQAARAGTDPILAGRVMMLVGDQHLGAGRPLDAEKAYAVALTCASSAVKQQALTGLAICACERGDLEHAAGLVGQGLALGGQGQGRATLLFRRGAVCFDQGLHDEGLAANEEALALVESLALGRLAQRGLNDQAEFFRGLGRLEDARATYLRVLAYPDREICEVARINLALVSAELGQFDRAETELDEGVHARMLPYQDAVRAGVYASRGQRDALGAVMEGLPEAGDADLAGAYQVAAEQAAAHGFRTEAARLGAAAFRGWTRLRRQDKEGSCLKLLGSLGAPNRPPVPIPLGPFELLHPLGAGGMGMSGRRGTASRGCPWR
jgi:tetratricopeptide (TPR) repeat protein